MRAARRWLAVLMFLMANSLGLAQMQPLGMPPFGSFQSLYGIDTIDMGNLNIHLQVPIYSKAGHGLLFTYSLAYDNETWFHANGSAWQDGGGWHESSPTDAGISYSHQTVCGTQTQYTNFIFIDTAQTLHSFAPMTLTSGGCNGTQTSGTTTSTDGLSLFFNAVNLQYTVTTPSGTQYGWNGSVVTLTDSNGNQISTTVAGLSFTDTLGTTAVARSANIFPATYTYTGPTGTQTINATWTTFPITTNPSWPSQGCASLGFSWQANFLTALSFPDGRSYSFGYDANGRLTTVTLPTGGQIIYNYNGPNGGMNCDGSISGMTVTTPDGTWTFTHTDPVTHQAFGTTTIIDPVGNKQVITFYQMAPNTVPYETQRIVYNASGSSVATTWTCYNGNGSNCPATTVSTPITQRSEYSWMGAYGALPSTLRSENYTSTSGLLTDKYVYDFWNGTAYPLVRRTNIQYATLSGNILDRPSSVTVYDGSSSQVAQTTYSNYDSHGNVGTVTRWVSSGKTLSRSFTYYAGGNVHVATDVNGAQTTYTYGACNGAFPTQVVYPLSLSVSATWNCNGGVMTSATDMNGQATTLDYSSQSVWRLSSVTDPAKATSFRYNNVNDLEQWFLFNGNQSIEDSRVTVDSMGRAHVLQTEQAPGSSYYDSIEIDYDGLGRPHHQTLPYSGTAEQTSGTAPGTAATFDALSRILTATDSSGATVTNTYQGTYKQDVFVALTPTPSGEANHNKQYEYDGLGRLISVCEITGGPGSGNCGQSVGQTGYITQYTYDALNRLTHITQGSQTRTFTYDGIGRLTSASTPERGTVTYTYDSIATGDCTGYNYPGDMIVRTQNSGRSTCFYYDLLHRLQGAGNGLHGTATCRRFTYDSAVINGVTMANAKGKLAEAKTDNCASTILTDEGFYYDAAGRLQNFYQSTPHSGGFYQVNISWWANGAPNVVSANAYGQIIPGMPIITYGLDGEGRAKTVSANSGQNPLTNASYSVAGLPTVVTLGSGDNDTFGYDTNTNRMTSYAFNVGSNSITGTLTWSANGSLRGLTIAGDPWSPANNQTCSFLYDDLIRLNSANCGTSWSQSFTYDPYGNVTKSGSSAWQPGYNSANNRYTLAGTSYDANGNLLTDSFHTYTWDADWNTVTSVDGVSVVADALGRIVEGAGQQTVYTPAGFPYMQMSGGTLVKAFVSLPAGAEAVYTSGGLSYYRHADWLGSSRLASTTGRACYSDRAFAPYGESYATACGNNDQDFTGQNTTLANDLYGFLFRQYHPTQGRWISPDPSGIFRLGNPQTLNQYAYVGGNPLRRIDPFGLVDIDATLCSPACGAYDGGMVPTDASSLPDQIPEPMFTRDLGGELPNTEPFMGAELPVTTFSSNAFNIRDPHLSNFNPATGVDTSDVAIGNNAAALAPAMNAGASFINFYVGATAATAAVAVTGVTAPGVLGAVADEVGFGSSVGRVFYSGYGSYMSAVTAAGTFGGTVLNETPVGRLLEFGENTLETFGVDSDILRPAWDSLSRPFAAGATGPVLSYQSWALGIKSTWGLVEYPELFLRGTKIIWMQSGW